MSRSGETRLDGFVDRRDPTHRVTCKKRDMGSFLNQGPFIVRYPYKKDPKRDPNLENYPYSRYPQGAPLPLDKPRPSSGVP